MASINMDQSTSEIRDKFQLVIDGLLNHEHTVTNDVYLEMLLSHLSGKHGEDYSSILAQPTLLDWIEKSSKQIQSEHPQSVHVYAFSIQLASLLAQDERIFEQLKNKNILNNLVDCVKTMEKLQNPSVKLSIVILFQSTLKHAKGIEWIREKRNWMLALDYIVQNQTIYVVRRSTEFITDFLFLIAQDDQLCSEIVGLILKPITDNVYEDDVDQVFVDSTDLQQKVMPGVNLVCSLLKRYIKQNEPSGLANHIINTFNGSVNLCKLTDMTQDRHFFDKILTCHVYINFARLVDTFMAKRNTAEMSARDRMCTSSIDYNEFGLNFLNSVKFCLLKNFPLSVFVQGKLYYEQWIALGDRVPEDFILGSQLANFENQIILFQIMPMLIVMKKTNSIYTEVTNEYISKLFDISAEHTLRICYSFRDSLLRDITKVPDIACKAIQTTLSLGKILNRDCAVILFQSLAHTVKGFAVWARDGNADSLEQHPALLNAVITGMYTIVKDYRITWKESFESVGVLNFMLYLLQHSSLSPTLAVNALKLTQLSIEQFLAPNLALLMDTLAGSDMQNLGPVILKRLHDNNWEVRDSTLELLSATASISKCKFPAFQEHILSNGLCPIVVAIAKNDSEPYVRASALNCLSQMVNIALYWDNCLHECNLTPYLVEVLKNEPEGVVRKEAVSLLASIFDAHKVPINQLDNIYSTLVYCAVNDLHWEVKIKALEFWEVIIRRQLQAQGVIDGNFPTVTFSKEKKKIVNLTPYEIISRLTKILDELSSRGCLGVLLSGIEEDSDLSVVKATVTVIKYLVDFLDKYNYWNEIQNQNKTNNRKSFPIIDTNYWEVNTSRPERKPECKPAPEPKPTEDIAQSEEVIQSIVSSPDINLLARTYESQMNVEPDPEVGIDSNYYKKFTHITAIVFLQKIKSINLDEIVRARSDWLDHTESFTSLLNDMLYSLKIDDVNDIDCY